MSKKELISVFDKFVNQLIEALKFFNPKSLMIGMTENGMMISKTKLLKGRKISKWSHNSKKSLMKTRSKKYLKELLMIKKNKDSVSKDEVN